MSTFWPDRFRTVLRVRGLERDADRVLARGRRLLLVNDRATTSPLLRAGYLCMPVPGLTNQSMNVVLMRLVLIKLQGYSSFNSFYLSVVLFLISEFLMRCDVA